MAKWIPTSKRLPEEGFVGQVLISRTWFNRIDKHYNSAVGECHFLLVQGKSDVVSRIYEQIRRSAHRQGMDAVAGTV